MICPTGAAGKKDQSKTKKIDIRRDPFMIGLINFKKRLPRRDITDYLFSSHRYRFKPSVRDDPLYSLCMQDSYMVNHIELLSKIRRFVEDRKKGRVVSYKAYTLPKRRLIQKIISAVWRTTDVPKHTDEIFVVNYVPEKKIRVLDDTMCRLSFNYFMYMEESGKKLPFRKYFLPQFHLIDCFLREMILSKYTENDLSDVDEKELLRSGIEPNPGPKYSCDRCGDVYNLPYMDIEMFYCRQCYPYDSTIYFRVFLIPYSVLRNEERRLRKINGRYNVSCVLCGGKLPDIMRYDVDSYKHFIKTSIQREVVCNQCSGRPHMVNVCEVNSVDRKEIDRLKCIYRGIHSTPKNIDEVYKYSAFRSYWFRRGVNVHLLDNFLPVMRYFLHHVSPLLEGHILYFGRFLLHVSDKIRVYPCVITLDYWPCIPIKQWHVAQEEEILPFLINLLGEDRLYLQFQDLLFAYQARQLPRV